MEKQKKTTWSERFNARLKEAPGEIFKAGKWRFWFPFLLILQIVNASLTVSIFASNGGAWETYVGAVMVAIGGVLCWLCVAGLHYSDSEDSRLAQRVSFLDSITLGFAIAHFCFLFWAQGHLLTLRRAEVDYKASAQAYNASAERVSDNAVKIAEANTKTAKLQNDTAYQQRKAAEKGVRSGGRTAAAASLSSVAPIELEKPKAPPGSSVDFLTTWDAWIRAAQFGELILAAITLIYIRNRSAKFNAVRQNAGFELLEASGDVFPVATGSRRQAVPQPALRQEYSKIAAPVATDPRKEALDALRGHLKVVASYLPGRWFKADLMPGGVRIRLCERRMGIERTVKKTEQSNKILSAVNAPDFRARLVAELKHQGFPIGKGVEL